MAQLIYATIMSLDGYIEDADGRFDWAEPDEDVHRFFNDLARPAGTYLYGRGMYETMSAWEADLGPAVTPGHAGLRRHLAGGRQGRLLDHARPPRHRQDPHREGLRPGDGPGPEGVGATATS